MGMLFSCERKVNISELNSENKKSEKKKDFENEIKNFNGESKLEISNLEIDNEKNELENFTEIKNEKYDVQEVIKNKESTESPTIVIEYAIVTANVLNLREEPNVDSKVIHKLKKNELISIISGEERSWVNVRLDKKDLGGWVFTKFISRTNEAKNKIKEPKRISKVEFQENTIEHLDLPEQVKENKIVSVIS